MKITETIERECCQPRDLKPYLGKVSFNRDQWRPQFCVHCGQIHVCTREMDASGNMDTVLTKTTIHDNCWE